jgi:hypothetical protein
LGTGEQSNEVPLTAEHEKFIRDVAFPQLDATTDAKMLERLADTFWSLCLWEQQRTTVLDTKAAALMGLSSLAAAVIAAGTIPGVAPGRLLFLARCISISLFILTVLLSIRAQSARKIGSFRDIDVFAALGAHKVPVGATPRFTDASPYECFLRELALQRWLVYRWRSDANDKKYEGLVRAQRAAAWAVVGLLVTVLTAVYR